MEPALINNWIRSVALILLMALCGVRPGQCQAGGKPTDVESLLVAIEHAISGWQDYQVKGDNELKGKHHLFKVAYKCPNFVRVDATEGQVSVQPDGSIRGRLGGGIFGRISRGIRRNDKRLQDEEGVPFYDDHFPALIVRIRQRITQGARATMEEDLAGYELEVHSSGTTWKYTFDKVTLFLCEDRRWVNGKEVEITHYTDFKTNTGLTINFFKF
jgi:hypothetical protein